jgi:hypothetical protein
LAMLARLIAATFSSAGSAAISPSPFRALLCHSRILPAPGAFQ